MTDKKMKCLFCGDICCDTADIFVTYFFPKIKYAHAICLKENKFFDHVSWFKKADEDALIKQSNKRRKP